MKKRTSAAGEATYDLGYITAFSIGASVSNMGHDLEYEIDWGDGTSEWVTHTYVDVPTDVVVDFSIRARARYIEHPDVLSAWSNVWLVHVVDP